MFARRARLLCCLLLVGALGCKEANRTAPQASAQPLPVPSSAPALASPEAPSTSIEPTSLLTANVSAYGATLVVDGDAFYLLTSGAAYRLVPGRAAERSALERGGEPVLMAEHLVYWSDGAFRRIPKRGGEPALLAKVRHAPQRIAASGDHFAWLDHADDGRYTLQTLDASQPRVVFAPGGDVAALTLLDDQVFFVEQAPGSTWRLGVVPIAGGSPRYTSPQRGRTPSMLAAAGEVFYYDGPSLTVHRVSPDLERDVAIAHDLICSPIAVSEQVYCAQPGGLVELPVEGGRARSLPRGRRGTITAIAASRSWVAWLVDTGENQLAVEALPIVAPPHP